MAEWRNDGSNIDAYMYLRNGLYFEVREHSFKSNEWQGTLWLKQPSQRIEIVSWDYVAYSLKSAKRTGYAHLKTWLSELANI